MFSTDQFYEAKVFLKSYADALDCIEESAKRAQAVKNYENKMRAIIGAKERKEIEFKSGHMVKGPNYKEGEQYRMLQFTHYVFRKYFPHFETSKNDYYQLTNHLSEGIDKLKFVAGEEGL
mmetsp:Transcript_25913/g.22850  ORF Transcript_25913/g.22850 Transcript_25913/m.22850 type:complete len:120 (+) Transcript_25913:40-399(+)